MLIVSMPLICHAIIYLHIHIFIYTIVHIYMYKHTFMSSIYLYRVIALSLLGSKNPSFLYPEQKAMTLLFGIQVPSNNYMLGLPWKSNHHDLYEGLGTGFQVRVYHHPKRNHHV